jgi:hypothetical protein
VPGRRAAPTPVPPPEGLTPLSIPSSVWTEPAALAPASCTAEQLLEFEELASASATDARAFRASRIAMGDWLNARFGPPGTRPTHRGEESIAELAQHAGLSTATLQRCRRVAHRWRGAARARVLESPVYVPFSVLLIAGQSSTDAFDEEEFHRRAEVLFRAMSDAEAGGVLEVTEPMLLRALKQNAETVDRAPRKSASIAKAVHHFTQGEPQAREQIINAVRDDTDAQRSVAAAYLMSRPALARAVLREEPELAALAAQEARQTGQPAADPDVAVLHELVQVLGATVPDDELTLAEWREDFARALGRFNQFVHDWYPADAVTQRADEALADLVARLAHDVTAWAADITAAHSPGLRLVGRTTS